MVIPFTPDILTRLALSAGLSLSAAPMEGHYVYLKPASYRFAPGKPIDVGLASGSLRAATRPLAQIKAEQLVVGTADSIRTWSPSYVPKKPGAYAVGITLAPQTRSWTGPAFNRFLDEMNLPEVLRQRRESNAYLRPVRERIFAYSKTLVLVADSTSPPLTRPLGLPSELVILQNQATVSGNLTLTTGTTIDVRPVFRSKQFLAGLAIIAGGVDQNGDRIFSQTVRTTANADPARVMLTKAGTWYVQFVYVLTDPRRPDEYDTHWTTLTFQVREGKIR